MLLVSQMKGFIISLNWSGFEFSRLDWIFDSQYFFSEKFGKNENNIIYAEPEKVLW